MYVVAEGTKILYRLRIGEANTSVYICMYACMYVWLTCSESSGFKLSTGMQSTYRLMVTVAAISCFAFTACDNLSQYSSGSTAYRI